METVSLPPTYEASKAYEIKFLLGLILTVALIIIAYFGLTFTVNALSGKFPEPPQRERPELTQTDYA